MEVDAEDSGEVDREYSAGTVSEGNGKNLTRPSVSWATAMLLP